MRDYSKMTDDALTDALDREIRWLHVATTESARRNTQREIDAIKRERESRTTTRIVDWDRDETDVCQKGTFGCCIDHDAETERVSEGSCETW